MNYPSIRIEGAILSPDIFERIEELPGQKPSDFGLESSAKVKDEIARAWADAQDYWRIFQRKLDTLKPDSPATTETRQQWVVPLLGLLGYQLEYQARGAELNGKVYNISHRATNRAQAPVQIVGYREPAGLDRKPERANMRMSAHAIVQEFLNLNEQLYGIVTNGRVLRLLRDSARLIKLSYLEFDLDRIFTDSLFADFAILYRLLHATRLPIANDSSTESLIERYHQDAIEQGTRIREGLRAAVTEALEILGTGFVAHPENGSLREQIDAGALEHTTFFSHLLRLIYRLLFLNVVEERGLIFPKGTPTTRLRTYFDYYSVQRLRRMARTRGLKTERHHDAWLSLLSTFQLFERPEQATKLGTTAFGGQLFDPESLGPLSRCRLTNAVLFDALDRLCSFDDPKTRQRLPVNFGALATEEFGSVYESLLELHPVIETAPSRHFSFKESAGNDRRTTGSYYTPTSLVDCLLDSALDPVLEARTRNYKGLGYASAEAAIMALRVCDPACGSGHFLIAAAQRIARRLAQIRAGDDEPSPDQLRHALREVISRCIYAVDINPMSVELCRVALWLEAVEPGKPLSFLDHHLRVGNSLLGATPQLIAAGIPDDAFIPIEGDDKKACAALKKQNKIERGGLGPLFAQQDAETQAHLQQTAAALADLPDDRPEDIRRKEAAFRQNEQTEEFRHKKQLADVWCAAFMIRKHFREPGIPHTVSGITQELLNNVANRCVSGTDQPLLDETARLAVSCRFFHWHLTFPEVFAQGGFDIVLGNPPWERVKLQQEEFFAIRDPAIAMAKNAAARRKMIAALPETNPILGTQWAVAVRLAESESAFLRLSGRYPLGGVGDVNTYAVFADLFRQSINPDGAAALLLPNGLVTGFTYRAFLRHLLQSRTLAAFYGFENEDKIFPEVHNETKFGILTMTGVRRPVDRPWFTAHIRQPDQAHDPLRCYSLTAEQIEAINPNTLNIPAFRWAADAEVAATIHAAAPALLRQYEDGRVENPWGIGFRTLFHMANDSGLFLDHADVAPRVAERRGTLAVLDDGSEVYPLYEGKMLWHFDHRYGSYAGQTEKQANKGVLPHVDDATHDDPDYRIQPRYWVDAAKVREALGSDANREWFFAWRDTGISERTFIGSIVPRTAAGDKAPLMTTQVGVRETTALVALLSSLLVDFDARQRSNLMKFYVVEQLAILTPKMLADRCGWLDGSARDWLADRVLELSYTNVELAPFARDLGCNLPPFRWLPERRGILQAEIDAAVFHLYRLTRSQTEWVLDSFTVLHKYEEREHGEFRTKRITLEIFDALAEAIRTGQSYQTPLTPPPADPRSCHRLSVATPILKEALP